MAKTRAQLNRKIRQDALRDQLEAKGLLQKVIETVEEIANPENEIDQHGLNRLKIANEQRLRLINKYLPDLKAVEISGDENSPLTITKVERVIVEPTNTNG